MLCNDYYSDLTRTRSLRCPVRVVSRKSRPSFHMIVVLYHFFWAFERCPIPERHQLVGTFTHAHPHVHIHMYIVMYIHTHIHMYIHTHMHIRTHTHAHAHAHTHTWTQSRHSINLWLPLRLPGPRITAASDRTFATPTSSGKHVGTETRCMSLLFASICIFLLRSKGLGALFSGAICNAFDHNCCCSRPILRKSFVVISIAFGRRGFAVACICGGSHEKLAHSFISIAQSCLRVFHDKYTRFSRLPVLRFTNWYTGNENPCTPLDFGGLNLPRTVGSSLLINCA